MATTEGLNRSLGTVEAEAVDAFVRGGGVLLDVRPPAAYGSAHVRGSVHVNAAAGGFAERVRMVLKPGTAVALVVDDAGQIHPSTEVLAADYSVVGVLAADPDRWLAVGLAVQSTLQIVPAALAARLRVDDSLQLLDVREPAEWQDAHIPGDRLIPLHALPERLHELDWRRPVAVYCRSGERSSVATSVLERAGFAEVANLAGGILAWVQDGLPVVGNPAMAR